MTGKNLKRVLSCVLVTVLILGSTFNAAALSIGNLVPAQVSEAEKTTYAGIKSTLDHSGLIGFDGENRLPDDNTPVGVIVIFNHLPAQTALVQAAVEGFSLSKSAAERNVQSDHDLFKRELAGLFPASPLSRSPAPYIISQEYYAALNGAALTLPANAVEELAEFESVYAVYPDSVVYAEPIERGESSVPFGNQNGGAAGRAAMGVDELHALGITGSGVDICVIDTGVDYNHPDLKDAFGTVSPRDNAADLLNGKFYGRNFVTGDTVTRAANDPMETTYAEYLASRMPEYDSLNNSYYTYHGTHVSGTIAGQDAVAGSGQSALGVAPDATLYVYRVFGTYSTSAVSIILAAIEMVDTDKPDVVNMSLGANVDDPYHMYSAAVNNIILNNPNIVFAVSAGNSGENGLFSLGAPGAAPSVITVGNAAPSYTRAGVGVYGNAGFISVSTILYPFYMPYGSGGEEAWCWDTDGNSIPDKFAGLSATSGKLVTLGMPNLSFVEDPYHAEETGTGTAEEFLALSRSGSNPNVNHIKGKPVVVRRGGDFLATMALAKQYEASALILFNRESYSGTTAGIEDFRGYGENYIPFYVITDYYDGITFRAIASTQGVSITGYEDAPFPIVLEPSSSKGPVGSTFDIKPDVVSDGSRVLSTVPIISVDGTYADAYMIAGGTSMASPHVAGVAALMRQYSNDKSLDWSGEEIKSRMMNNATVFMADEIMGYAHSVYEIGAGFVNAYNAIYNDTVVTVNYSDNGLVDIATQTFASFHSGAFSFGWIDAQSETSVTRKLSASITNNGSTSKTYSINYISNFVDNQTYGFASISAGWGTPRYTITSSVTSLMVEAGATKNFDLTLTVPTALNEIGTIEGYLNISTGWQDTTPVNVPVGAYSKIVSPPLKEGEFYANRPVISTGADAQSSYSADLDIVINLRKNSVFSAYVLDYEKSRSAAKADGTLDFEDVLKSGALIGDLDYSVNALYVALNTWYHLNDVVQGGRYTEYASYDADGYPVEYGRTVSFQEGPATIMFRAITEENEIYDYYVDFYVDNTVPTLRIDGLDTDGDYPSIQASTVITGNVYDDSADILKEMGLGYHVWEPADPFTTEPNQQFTVLFAHVGGKYYQADVNTATGDFELTVPAAALPYDITFYAVDGFSIRSLNPLRDINVTAGFDPSNPSMGDYCSNILQVSGFGFIGSNVAAVNVRVDDGEPAVFPSVTAITLFPGENIDVSFAFNGAAKRAGDSIADIAISDPMVALFSINGQTVNVSATLEGTTELTVTTRNGLQIIIPITVNFNPGHGIVLPAGSYINYGAMNHISDFDWELNRVTWMFDILAREYEEDVKPILWKVMGNEILPDGSSSDALTILSEYILDCTNYGDDGINRFSDGPDYNPHHWLNGGTYGIFDWESWQMKWVQADSKFFPNFSQGELDAIPTVDNEVFMYANGSVVPESSQTAHAGKFFLPWVDWNYNFSTNVSTNNVYWSLNSGRNPANALAADIVEGSSSAAAATFRNGKAYSYWSETVSGENLFLYSVNADGSVTANTHCLSYNGIRPGATLDSKSIVYAEKDDDGVYKLTVIGANNGADIGVLTGDAFASYAPHQLTAGDILTVEAGIEGSAYDKVMYKIVDSQNNIIEYGELDTEALENDGKLTIDTSALTSGGYKIYVWPQQDDTLRSNVAGTVKVLNVTITDPIHLVATANIRGSATGSLEAPVEYIISMQKMKKVLNTRIYFEVDGSMLESKGLDVLAGGFTALDVSEHGTEPIRWTNMGNGVWQGEIMLMTFGTDGFTSDAAVDMAKVIYAAKQYGFATMKLTKLEVVGIDENDTVVYLDSAIGTAEAATSIIKVYSIYDLNKDGVIDALDLGIVQRYYMSTPASANWDAAKVCDFDGNGCVDINDLIQLFLQYAR